MGVTESHLLALLGETLAEDDAEWMPGKSRTRLTPDLDNGFLMDAPVPVRAPGECAVKGMLILAGANPAR
jgi:hypothetical protein